MNTSSKALITIIAALVVLAIIYGFIVQNNQPIACTEEAKLCPDGSYVGRIPPNCDFAPCPSKCPEIRCVWDPCPGNHIPDENGCVSCASPCNSSATKGTEDLCKASGGTVRTQLCCKSVEDFPNTCLIGGCGCSLDNSHNVKVCDCGENKCWDNTNNQCVNL